MDSEADQVSFQTGALSLPSDMTEIAENYRRQRQTQGQPLQPAADGRLRGDPQPGAQPIIVAGPDGGPAANADQPDTRGAGERVQAPEQARIIDCGCTIQEGEEESTQPADSCRCNPLAKIVVDKNQSRQDFVRTNKTVLLEHWKCPASALRKGQREAVVAGDLQWTKILLVEEMLLKDGEQFDLYSTRPIDVTRARLKMDISTRELEYFHVKFDPNETPAPIRFDPEHFEVLEDVHNANKVTILRKTGKVEARESFYKANRVQFCQMWTGGGKTGVLWVAALGNHPVPYEAGRKVWIWCSMDASKDSIDKERRVFTDDDSHLLQKEKFDASLMRKLGLTFECLEWLNGRVYTGSRNHALTLEDIERYDIFILHPACLADRAKKVKKGKNGDKEGNEGGKGKEKVVDDEPNTSELFSSDSVRTAFMKAIGVVLVDEGDFGTVKTSVTKVWCKLLDELKAFITFFSATAPERFEMPPPYVHVTYHDLLLELQVREAEFHFLVPEIEFDGNLLTVGEALNLHREKVTLRDEASARMYIKAGLKVYYTFLNSEDNLGFPGALAVFIQDKGGPVKALGDAAVRLLEPAVITSLFNDCLLELADDPAFEHLTRNGSGAYDHLRGRNVRVAYVSTRAESETSQVTLRQLDKNPGIAEILINQKILGRSYDNPLINGVFHLCPSVTKGPYFQKVGRALREAKPSDRRIEAGFTSRDKLEEVKNRLTRCKEAGKHQKAIIIDVSSNGHRPHTEVLEREEGTRAIQIMVPVAPERQPAAASLASGYVPGEAISRDEFGSSAAPTAILLDSVDGSRRYRFQWLAHGFNDLEEPGYVIALLNSGAALPIPEYDLRSAMRYIPGLAEQERDVFGQYDKFQILLVDLRGVATGHPPVMVTATPLAALPQHLEDPEQDEPHSSPKTQSVTAPVDVEPVGDGPPVDGPERDPPESQTNPSANTSAAPGPNADGPTPAVSDVQLPPLLNGGLPVSPAAGGPSAPTGGLGGSSSAERVPAAPEGILPLPNPDPAIPDDSGPTQPVPTDVDAPNPSSAVPQPNPSQTEPVPPNPTPPEPDEDGYRLRPRRGNGGKTTAASSDQGEGGASGGTKKRKRARRLRPQAESSGGQGNEDSGEDLRPGSGEESEDIDLEDEEAINNKETDEDYDPNEGRGYEERDKRENRRLAVRAHDELGAEKRSKRKRTPKGNGEAQKKQSLAPSEDAAYTYVANRDPSVAVLRIRLQGDRMVLDKDFEDAPPVRPPIQNRGGEPGPMSNGEELAKLFESILSKRPLDEQRARQADLVRKAVEEIVEKDPALEESWVGDRAHKLASTMSKWRFGISGEGVGRSGNLHWETVRTAGGASEVWYSLAAGTSGRTMVVRPAPSTAPSVVASNQISAGAAAPRFENAQGASQRELPSPRERRTERSSSPLSENASELRSPPPSRRPS